MRIQIELGSLSFDNQSVYQSSQARVPVSQQVDDLLSNISKFSEARWLDFQPFVMDI